MPPPPSVVPLRCPSLGLCRCRGWGHVAPPLSARAGAEQPTRIGWTGCCLVKLPMCRLSRARIGADRVGTNGAPCRALPVVGAGHRMPDRDSFAAVATEPLTSAIWGRCPHCLEPRPSSQYVTCGRRACQVALLVAVRRLAASGTHGRAVE